MHALVAILMPAGDAFVDQLRRAWDSGDAVLPVDTRLPETLVAQLLDTLAPAYVIDATGDRHARPAHRPVAPGDALVVATSGTTGVPKGVVLTHDAVLASARATSARLAIDPARHRWLCCLPIAHIGGLSVITRALLTDTPLDMHRGFDAVAVQRAAQDGATHTSLVSAALARIDPTHFERILLGGSAAPPQMPANCTLTYGMTETGSGIWYDNAALDGVEIVVRDDEILVRAPMLLRAYRHAATDTDPRNAEGWFPTGDAGAITDDGQLVVHGRRGNVIVTGGEKVWPEAVERVLAEHPAVADVLVYGIADPHWGQRVIARVVPTSAVEPPSVDALRAYARDRLAPYALPRAVEFVSALERTVLGKLRRL